MFVKTVICNYIWFHVFPRCTTTFHSDGLVNWLHECDFWIGFNNVRHFLSSRGGFSRRLFWQTLQRSRSAGPWMLVPHSRKPSKSLGCHQRRVQTNQDPQRQTPTDCNDVSTMGTVRWYIHRVECSQQDHPIGKHTLRTVAAKYLYSDWVWLLCYISQIVYTTIPHP